MKKMKRFLAMLLVIALSVGCLPGCAQGEQEKVSSESKAETEKTENAESSQSGESENGGAIHPVTTEPITISILTRRHAEATNNADEIWFFQYLEYWLAQQGYNVTIEVQQTEEADQQVSLMLGTDSLPDIVWAIPLSTNRAVIYGESEGLIMDWTPYINEEYMPNFYKAIQEDQSALTGSTTPGGGVYGIPKLSRRTYGNATSTISNVDRMFVNTKWLEQCGLDMPTNLDEFLDMLRTFKNEMKLENGDEVIPAISNANFLEMAIWLMQGYYGGKLTKYGNGWTIKDGKLEYPVYTEDYKTFIDIMKTMYDEGLISPDHFSMDEATIHGYTNAGAAGVVFDWTLEYVDDFTLYEAIPWFSIGDADPVISTYASYTYGAIWASAKTEYPEVVALIVDYLYSPEGACMMQFGPKEGEDPLGMVDGWYVDEDNNITTKAVADGSYPAMDIYCYQYIRSHDTAGFPSIAKAYALELAGIEVENPIREVYDVILGETFATEESRVYLPDNAQDHWFMTNTKASEPYITTLRLPSVHMSEEDSLRATELKTVLDNHITSESAKFITGDRPVDEIDEFHEELKAMGVEEYIALYEAAYSSYLSNYFD